MVSKEELRKLSKEKLVDLVYDLLIRVDKLTAEVQELRKEVIKLKTPKNSSNSSLPPSHDLLRFKNQSLRGKSDKKSGGQSGHKRETLLMSSNPDKTIEHRSNEKCPQCGKIHTNEPEHIISRRQVIDIPYIKASVIEHQIIQSTCTCGYVSTGNFPADVTVPVQYGNNLIALIAYLSSRQYIPYACLSELIRSITNISMSEGTIFNLLNKAADIVLPIYEGIKEEISKATTVGGDESGIKVKKVNFWAWTWQTLLATYIVISNTRGFITVEKTFPDGFPNATYVSDSLSAQLKTVAKRHQLCLAHLLRELKYFEELYHHKWVTDMTVLLKRAIKLKDKMTLEQYTETLEERNAILIEYDNNGSERSVRTVKIKQKVSGSFRSERGAEIFAILRSVFDTIIKKGGNPFETIRFAVNIAASKNEFQANLQR
jgi:transposase